MPSKAQITSVLYVRSGEGEVPNLPITRFGASPEPEIIEREPRIRAREAAARVKRMGV